MTSRLRRPAGALLAGALVAGVLGNSPLAHAAGDPVSGTVTAVGGEALADIQVAAMQNEGTMSEPYWQNIDFATTDEYGHYSFPDLPDGTYRLEFGDRLNANPWASEFYDDQPTVATAQDITVVGGAADGPFDAELAAESTISGTVTGAAGEGLAGAGVYVYERAGGAWAYLDETRTGDDGTYLLRALPQGTYRVEFQYETPEGDFLGETWNNVQYLPQGQDIVVAEDGKDVEGVDAELVAGEFDPVPFTLVTEPAISGVQQVGNTLTVSTGTWNPTPATTEIYWFRGEEYTGVSGPTYSLTAADAGQVLTVLVQVYAPDGQYEYANATTGAIAAAPVPAVTPPAPVVTPPAPVVTPPAATITFPKSMDVKGSLKVGSMLKLTKYKATSGSTVSYTFQWYAGSKKIKKATKAKLKVTKALKGKKISVKVTAKAGTTTKKVKVKVGKVR
ncbi:carboxypeptidase-like regulatory domain-containing protein [Nocardioides sediminis]|uniref:carboxypeptidase-like regulatory domain-containing protein n=1 Tax=Nocardioides sediminis TaxID=433648 RepID=UPI00131F1764|nr:carboxypeptidase-like regulatory domain-containing protein [Nocardioides sediminis]